MLLAVERRLTLYSWRSTKITLRNSIVSLIEPRSECLFITTWRRYVPHDRSVCRMSYEGRLNRRNWSSSDRTRLKIKRGRRSDAFNANRSPRIAGSKIIHVGEVSPAMLFARVHAGICTGAMSYAYGHAFARKFQLNFICGVAIESPPNRPPAINLPFPRFIWPRLQVKVRGASRRAGNSPPD